MAVVRDSTPPFLITCVGGRWSRCSSRGSAFDRGCRTRTDDEGIGDCRVHLRDRAEPGNDEGRLRYEIGAVDVVRVYLCHVTHSFSFSSFFFAWWVFGVHTYYTFTLLPLGLELSSLGWSRIEARVARCNKAPYTLQANTAKRYN